MYIPLNVVNENNALPKARLAGEQILMQTKNILNLDKLQ